MADEEPTMTTTEPVRTAQDLEIEKLNDRLNSIESNYQARIKELEDANRGLWAQLHPVQTEPTVTEVPQDDPAEKALYDALGLK